MEPFYSLSEESSSSSSSTDATYLTTPSPSPTTHDTSRASYHIKDITSFAEDLQDAADRAFPNRGRSRYQTVNVCLIRWSDDDLEVKDELDRLHEVFETVYGFNTEMWLIPSAASQIQLTSMTCNFLQEFDAEGNLFILYYGGHGTINKARQNQWWCKPNLGSPYVDWSSIQTLFESAMSDVLVLLDCCAAASSAPGFGQGVMEAIAACGFETKAPPPGEYSFTNTLIEVLLEWADRPCFSAAMLHTEILFTLKQKRPERGRDGRKYEWCSTPIHLVYTGNPKAPGIEICSMRNGKAAEKVSGVTELQGQRSTAYVDAMDLDEAVSENPLTACNSSGDYQVPHVLISIALDESQTCLDAASCRRWLADFPALAKYATVEGIYKSYSTLVTLSMPIMIWDLIPENPACSFIGYITSPNKYHAKSLSEKTALACQAEDSCKLNQLHSKTVSRRRSMSGDSSYESGSESPDHHELVVMAARKACLTKSDPQPKGPLNDPAIDDPPFDPDEDSDFDPAETDSNEISDWEDVLPPANSPKADEKALFRRIDSRPDLASKRSLLTAMLSGSLPAAPVEIGSMKQARKQRYQPPEQKGLSPRSTRRNMLTTELSVSLRQHLLLERQQRTSRVSLASQHEMNGNDVKMDRSNSF